MKFNEYMKLVNELKNAYPEWRMGQTFFNALQEIDEELADSVRGREADPFYQDEKIPEFLGVVATFFCLK
jgi:hypothetical protein